MPTDYFLAIDGIKGESTDEKHKDQIEVLGFRWAGQQPTQGSKSGLGLSTGKVNLDDLTITKALDKASPPIYKALCSGQHLKKVVLELCRATGEKQEYMEYSMEDVLITRVSSAGADQAENAPLPKEDVTFTFAKIKWTYTELDHQTGKSKGKVTASFDLSANKVG